MKTMQMTSIEWRVPKAALDWKYETEGKGEMRKAAFLLLRLLAPTLAFIVAVLYFVLPERLNAEFFGLILFGYVSMGTMITSLPLLSYWESRRVGIYYHLNERGWEWRRGSKKARKSWKDLRGLDKRVTAHPGVAGLMAVELSVSFRGETIRRYWAFDPNETSAEQIALLLRRSDEAT